jgi:hypothetical protein
MSMTGRTISVVCVKVSECKSSEFKIQMHGKLESDNE